MRTTSAACKGTGLGEKYLGSSFDLIETLVKNLDDVLMAKRTLDVTLDVLFLRYSANAGQTAFEGPDLTGRTLTIQQGNPRVYVNRVLSDPSTYTVENGERVRFLAPLQAGDIVHVSSFGINPNGTIFFDELTSNESLQGIVQEMREERELGEEAKRLAEVFAGLAVDARNEALEARDDIYRVSLEVVGITSEEPGYINYDIVSRTLTLFVPAGPRGPKGPTGDPGPAGTTPLGLAFGTFSIDAEGMLKMEYVGYLDPSTVQMDDDGNIFIDTSSMNTPTPVAAGPKIAQFSNQPNSSNLRATRASQTPVPVFGTAEMLDTGFFSRTTNGVVALTNGRHRISVSLFLTEDAGSLTESAPAARLTVNGVERGPIAATGYIRNASGHQEASLHINTVLDLQAGDTVRVITWNEASGSAPYRLGAAGTSTFTIEK